MINRIRPGQDEIRIDRYKILLDLSDGGAWPLLVVEVIFLLNCVNERDLCLLIGGGDDFKQLWGWCEGFQRPEHRLFAVSLP